MSEKKTVRRSVAIALGIVCIVVVAGLVGAFAYYVNDKNNTISSLNSQVSQLNTNATSLRNQIDSLNFNVTNLQNQVNNLTDILNLSKSMVLYNGTLTIFPLLELTMLDESVPYAGYVSVQVSSSQSNATVIITVVWNYYPVLRYQNDFNLGTSGTAIFPVLPPSMVVYFCDPKLTNSSELANVTITYYY
jgi:predicted PurR-regulated permease PerM